MHDVTANFWERLDQFGSNIALIAGADKLDYQTLAARADAAVRSIELPAGITRPLVLIETANAVEPITFYLGALRAEWPVILAAPQTDQAICETFRPNIIYRRDEFGWGAKIQDPTPVVCDPELAVLLATSGSTGSEKLVRLSADNIDSNTKAICEYLDVRPTDRAITTLQWHYSYGLSVVHAQLNTGAAIVLSDLSVGQDEFWEFARGQGVTSLSMVPVQFSMRDLSDFSRRQLPSLRYVTQAGGRLGLDTAQRLAGKSRDEGWDFLIMYGQTEASPRMAFVPPGSAPEDYDTVGRAIPGGQLSLRAADGETVTTPGVPGELCYQGPNVMMGYALARADLGKPKDTHHLKTGDIAEITPNGFFRIVGREGRFIKIDGVRFGLDDIERRLAERGLGVHCAGRDENLAVFSTDTSTSLATIARFLNDDLKLSSSKFDVIGLDAVPLLSNQKVDYKALNKLACRHRDSDRTNTIGLEDTLKAALRTGHLESGQSFVEHGGDSLAYLEVQLKLSQSLGHVPVAWEDMPVGDLLALKPDRAAGNTRSNISINIPWRIAALMAVIAHHTTSWPVTGGAYLLMVVAGFSLARFQSVSLFRGDVGHVIRTMLLPIVLCYYAILTAVHVMQGPIDPEWFFLLGNLDRNINPAGIEPYWFVCAYVQVLALASLPFSLAPVRKWASVDPFSAGLIAILSVIAVVEILGIRYDDPGFRLRHSVAALELFGIGWCLYFAEDIRQRIIALAMTAVVLVGHWNGIATSATLFIVLGVLGMASRLEFTVPRILSELMLKVAALTMFIYLAHPIVQSAISRLWDMPDAALFLATVLVSIFVAPVLKGVLEFGLRNRRTFNPASAPSVLEARN